MRISDPRYQQWLKMNTIKKGLHEHKRKLWREYLRKLKQRQFHSNVKITHSDDRHVSRIQANAPHNFSISRNTEQTIGFFNSIISGIRNARHKVDVYFNLEDVRELTIDSIMYLLAVLYNMKTTPRVQYITHGNYPRVLLPTLSAKELPKLHDRLQMC
mgnify:CR=1 FL=1